MAEIDSILLECKVLLDLIINIPEEIDLAHTNNTEVPIHINLTLITKLCINQLTQINNDNTYLQDMTKLTPLLFPMIENKTF